MPTVIEIDGSSMVIGGRGFGSLGSVSVSPIMISSIPATATISPGRADSAGTRSRPLVSSSSVSVTFLMPRSEDQAAVGVLFRAPLGERARATRPRGCQQLGNFNIVDAVFGGPGSRLVSVRGTVADAQQCQASQEGRVVQVGHMSLQYFALGVGRCRNVLHDRGEQWFQVLAFW